MNDTWDYSSDIDLEDNISDDIIMIRLRNKRNALMAECDWRMVSDSPFNTQEWIDYRQALRDLPSNSLNPREAAWPISPDGIL